MKKLGIIGGLGPMATAYFMQMVTEMTKAKTDQEHIEIILHSRPSIPDRTKYILGESKENPEPEMAAVGKELAERGAELIAIPCVTAGYFYPSLRRQIPVPVIDMIAECARYLKGLGVRSAGLMATDGTVKSGLFQNALHAKGIRLALPSEKSQKDVMHLIYKNVKASKPVDMERFFKISKELENSGAQVILLGCTELSVIRKDQAAGAGYLDVMQVLAKCAVERCGILREEFENLITKQ